MNEIKSEQPNGRLSSMTAKRKKKKKKKEVPGLGDRARGAANNTTSNDDSNGKRSDNACISTYAQTGNDTELNEAAKNKSEKQARRNARRLEKKKIVDSRLNE